MKHEIETIILQNVLNAALLRDRGLDFAARYGGEEFAIALPATESSMAVVIAERLRKAVAALPRMDENGELAPVTVSIGVATIWPRLDTHPTLLIEAADRAL